MRRVGGKGESFDGRRSMGRGRYGDGERHGGSPIPMCREGREGDARTLRLACRKEKALDA